MRRALSAAIVMTGLATVPAMAQRLPAPVAAQPTPVKPGVAVPGASTSGPSLPGARELDAAKSGAAAPSDASLSHSAFKATTYKAGTTLVNFALLSAAAGGATGGAALAAIALGASWTLYTVNDYLWDRYEPPPAKQDATDSFDPDQDLWRNTKKFLTYKPAIAAFKYATVYAYTGSISAALIYGSATVVANTGVFYANNVAWDLYDWYLAPPRQTAVAKP